MTRNGIIWEFVRLSEEILAAEAAGSVTREEATIVIERYRGRADVVLEAIKQAEKGVPRERTKIPGR